VPFAPLPHADGTSAAYYFKPAPAGSALSNVWVMYLEGSMFCWGGESCHDRYHSREYWMSSSIWATEMAQGGIFDDNPGMSAFADANLVYLKYCAHSPSAFLFFALLRTRLCWLRAWRMCADAQRAPARLLRLVER
jgi:hypothetical protein